MMMRIHMCDYVVQNSPAKMSYRAWASAVIVPMGGSGSFSSRLAKNLMHFDMFAGCRNLQRMYCCSLIRVCNIWFLQLLPTLLLQVRQAYGGSLTCKNHVSLHSESAAIIASAHSVTIWIWMDVEKRTT